jgi:hypothetical protein
MQRIAAFAIAALIATPAVAEESSNFQLFDHFAIAQVAGELCAERTEAEKLAYAEKFEALAGITERDALAANPDLTSQSFQQFTARRRHNLQASVFQFLEAETCNHAEAQALVAKYTEFLELPLPD